MASGRMPRMTSRPSAPARSRRRPRWRAAARCRPLAPRHGTPRPPSACSSRAGIRFIDGEPMKPATKMLAGRVVDLARRAELLEHALLHHGDARGQRHRLDLVVGDVDDRRAEPLVQLLDLGAHLDAQLGVEVGERLVEQEELADRAPARGPSRRAGAGRRRAGRACGRAAARSAAASRPASTASSLLGLRHAAHLQAEGDVLRAPSCSGRARRTGTPWRCRGPSACSSLTAAPPMRISPVGDASPARRSCQAAWTCRSRTARPARGTRRRRRRGRCPSAPRRRRSACVRLRIVSDAMSPHPLTAPASGRGRNSVPPNDIDEERRQRRDQRRGHVDVVFLDAGRRVRRVLFERHGDRLLTAAGER